MLRHARAIALLICTATLLLAAGSAEANRTYKLKFKTGTKSGAGTDSNISVKLYGITGSSNSHKVNGHISGNAFENGDTDHCSVSYGDHGAIWKIDVKSDGSGLGSDWYLDTITISSSEPDHVETTTFSFHRWIDKSSGTVTRYCVGYKAPTAASVKSGTLYYRQAYVCDNMNGASTRGLKLDHTVQVTSKKELSTTTTSSQTHQLTTNWSSPETVLGSFGTEFKSTWNKSISSTSASSNGINITTSYDFSELLRAEAKSYTIVLIQELYDFNFTKMDDSFTDDYWLRYVSQTPTVNNPKTFNFGPSFDKVTWADFTSDAWHDAITTALGDMYNQVVDDLQAKGHLENPSASAAD